MSQLVLAMFDDRDMALAAADALADAGVDPTCIGLLAVRPERLGQLGSSDLVEPSAQPTSLRAGKGPVSEPDDTEEGPSHRGHTPGWVLRDIARPTMTGLGPVVMAGPISSALRASPAWPAERALVDALVRRGVGSAEARVAAEEVRRGSILLTVHDGHGGRAERILRRYHPVELQT